MLILTALGILFCLAYVVLSLAFLTGTETHDVRSGAGEEPPRVSVVIAARNEARNLRRCVASVMAQVYPPDRFDVMVVDDRSSDGTPELLREMSSSYPKLRSIRIKDDPPELAGKENALAVGIEATSGEVILIIDADCRVPPLWIREMVAEFRNGVGLVAGMSIPRGGSLFTRLQSADLLYLLTLAGGAIGIGRPVSILGNNFGFTREAYLRVGGFRGVGFSITEDLALMNAINSRTEFKTGFCWSPEAIAESIAPENPGEFFSQRLRWALGGLKSGLAATSVMTIAFGLRLTALLLLGLSPAGAAPLSVPLGILAASSATDLLVLIKGALISRRFDLIPLFPLLVPFQFIYNLIIGAAVALGLRTVNWKGRVYGPDPL